MNEWTKEDGSGYAIGDTITYCGTRRSLKGKRGRVTSIDIICGEATVTFVLLSNGAEWCAPCSDCVAI